MKRYLGMAICYLKLLYYFVLFNIAVHNRILAKRYCLNFWIREIAYWKMAQMFKTD